MSSSIAYNQLTAVIVSLAGLSSCFAGMSAVDTTGFDKLLMFGIALTLIVASGISWQNKNPMIVGALLCVVGILAAIVINTPKNMYVSETIGTAEMPTGMPTEIYRGIGFGVPVS